MLLSTSLKCLGRKIVMTTQICMLPTLLITWSFFKTMQSGLLSLDRDDTGRGSNTFSLPDGRKGTSAWNEERVTIRGIVEGEYIVNVHMDRKSSSAPTKVEVSLYKTDSSEDIMVHQKVVTLSAERQEETAFRFTLMKDGNVVDINELPKS